MGGALWPAKSGAHLVMRVGDGAGHYDWQLYKNYLEWVKFFKGRSKTVSISDSIILCTENPKEFIKKLLEAMDGGLTSVK